MAGSLLEVAEIVDALYAGLVTWHIQGAVDPHVARAAKSSRISTWTISISALISIELGDHFFN